MSPQPVQRAALRSDNTSGFKGVSPWGEKWRACIRDHDGRWFAGPARPADAEGGRP